MVEYVQVSTTTETKEDAEMMAKALVDRRIAGCVHIIGPITSVYRWKGKTEKAEEWLCQIKTKRELYNEVEDAILEVHKYETPEIVSAPIISGSKEYLQWLNCELKAREK
jgi:periplasmic divalent cation tolerance protein